MTRKEKAYWIIVIGCQIIALGLKQIFPEFQPAQALFFMASFFGCWGIMHHVYTSPIEDTRGRVILAVIVAESVITVLPNILMPTDFFVAWTSTMAILDIGIPSFYLITRWFLRSENT